IPAFAGMTNNVFRHAPMHDLRWIRENPEEFDRSLERRGLAPRAAEVLALDKEWRALQTAAEEAQATRNRLSREVGAAKARGEPEPERPRQGRRGRQCSQSGRIAKRDRRAAGEPAEPAGARGTRRPGRDRQPGAAPRGPPAAVQF